MKVEVSTSTFLRFYCLVATGCKGTLVPRKETKVVSDKLKILHRVLSFKILSLIKMVTNVMWHISPLSGHTLIIWLLRRFSGKQRALLWCTGGVVAWASVVLFPQIGKVWFYGKRLRRRRDRRCDKAAWFPALWIFRGERKKTGYRRRAFILKLSCFLSRLFRVFMELHRLLPCAPAPALALEM